MMPPLRARREKIYSERKYTIKLPLLVVAAVIIVVHASLILIWLKRGSSGRRNRVTILQVAEERQLPTQLPRHIISYGGEKWTTPTEAVIAPVFDATISPPFGQVRNSTKVYDFGKWYWEETTTTTQDYGEEELDSAISEETLLTLVQIYSYSFQHIVFDTLPKLFFVCPFLMERENANVRVLVMSTLQRELVMEGCPSLHKERFLMFESNLAIRSPVVYVPYYHGEKDLKMGLVPPNSVRSLGSQLAPGTDVIYLPRMEGTIRSVANEKGVISTLRTKWPNLRIVHITNEWNRDRWTVRNASIIIAPHGGALANMIFAPPNTTIIEFTSMLEYKRAGKNERPCYLGLAHGLGFKYHAVAPSIFDFDSGSMVVPTDRILDVLSKL